MHVLYSQNCAGACAKREMAVLYAPVSPSSRRPKRLQSPGADTPELRKAPELREAPELRVEASETKVEDNCIDLCYKPQLPAKNTDAAK